MLEATYIRSIGRGTQTKASALVFGPRRRQVVRADHHAESRLRGFLGDLNDNQARKALLDFLSRTKIGSAGDHRHSETIDNYSLWLWRRLDDASPAFGSDESPCAETDPELDGFLRESRIVLSRLGHRIEESCLEELLDTYIGADLWNGDGFVEFSETIERLVESTLIEHRARRVVYAKRGDDSAATHYRSTNPELFIACDRQRVLDGSWRELRLGERPVTCKKCLAKKHSGRDTNVLWHRETAADKVERLHYGLVEKAVPKVLADVRRRLPIRAEDFAQEARRAVWHAFVAELSDHCQGSGFPLDHEQVGRLEGMWLDPRQMPPRNLPALKF